jgi:hypothetical protein
MTPPPDTIHVPHTTSGSLHDRQHSHPCVPSSSIDLPRLPRRSPPPLSSIDLPRVLQLHGHHRRCDAAPASRWYAEPQSILSQRLDRSGDEDNRQTSGLRKGKGRDILRPERGRRGHSVKVCKEHAHNLLLIYAAGRRILRGRRASTTWYRGADMGASFGGRNRLLMGLLRQGRSNGSATTGAITGSYWYGERHVADTANSPGGSDGMGSVQRQRHNYTTTTSTTN